MMSTDRGDSIRDDIYSKAVRAGKRTYFFDVKSTKGNDLYLTITESKKKLRDGNAYYEKHKIFLYKEDFEKFAESLMETIEKIKEIRSGNNEFIDPMDEADSPQEGVESDSFTDVTFDDLDER
jgi:hypothetical protein